LLASYPVQFLRPLEIPRAQRPASEFLASLALGDDLPPAGRISPIATTPRRPRTGERAARHSHSRPRNHGLLRSRRSPGRPWLIHCAQAEATTDGLGRLDGVDELALELGALVLGVFRLRLGVIRLLADVVHQDMHADLAADLENGDQLVWVELRGSVRVQAVGEPVGRLRLAPDAVTQLFRADPLGDGPDTVLPTVDPQRQVYGVLRTFRMHS